jgi:hypothetical protein
MKALVVTLLLLVSVVAGVRPSKLVHQVPAVYVFGDSMLDVGNNNHLPGEEEVARADKPSTRRFTNNYGVDLPGSGKPTGRFSNGYNVADFVGTYPCVHSFIYDSLSSISLIQEYVVQRFTTRICL